MVLWTKGDDKERWGMGEDLGGERGRRKKTDCVQMCVCFKLLKNMMRHFETVYYKHVYNYHLHDYYYYYNYFYQHQYD